MSEQTRHTGRVNSELISLQLTLFDISWGLSNVGAVLGKGAGKAKGKGKFKGKGKGKIKGVGKGPYMPSTHQEGDQGHQNHLPHRPCYGRGSTQHLWKYCSTNWSDS